jgi:hypothetical protein
MTRRTEIIDTCDLCGAEQKAKSLTARERSRDGFFGIGMTSHELDEPVWIDVCQLCMSTQVGALAEAVRRLAKGVKP